MLKFVDLIQKTGPLGIFCMSMSNANTKCIKRSIFCLNLDFIFQIYGVKSSSNKIHTAVIKFLVDKIYTVLTNIRR